MRARFVNESTGTKDVARMESLRDKSKGDHQRELNYANAMAKAITKPGKAEARGEAAEQIFGSPSDIADIFYNRAAELSGGQAVEAVPSKIPGEKDDYSQYAAPQSAKQGRAKGNNTGFRKGGFAGLNVGIHREETEQREPKTHGRWGSWNGMSILTLGGNVNLKTGNSPAFNVYDTWPGDDEVVEVWEKSNGKYFLTFTSGAFSSHRLGDKAYFHADQSGRSLFNGDTATLVDYTFLKDAKALIPLYGTSFPAYVYK